MSLAVAALQSTRHAVAHATAATAQAFHARTTTNAREETSAVHSPFISKQMDIEDDEGGPSVDDE